MTDIMETVYDYCKRFFPFIIGGLMGSVVHRMRNQMNFAQFAGSIVISVFVALSVGIICRDYFEVEEESIIFVLCGVSGTFSKVILDEVEEILKNISVIFKNRFVKKND